MATIEEKRRYREAYLGALYDATEGAHCPGLAPRGVCGPDRAGRVGGSCSARAGDKVVPSNCPARSCDRSFQRLEPP
jgi:hypothetical protein